MAGGKGLGRVPRGDARRQAPARTRRLSRSSTRSFPASRFAGGVCYFLWDRDIPAPCEVDARSGTAVDRTSRAPATSMSTTSSSGATRPFRSCEKVMASRQASRRFDDKRFATGSSQTAIRPTHVLSEAADAKASEHDLCSSIQNGGTGCIAASEITSERRPDRQVEGASCRACSGTRSGDKNGPDVSSARRFIAEPRHCRAPRPTSLLGPFDTESEARNLLVLSAHAIRPLPRLAAQDHPGRHARASTLRARLPDWTKTWTDAEALREVRAHRGRDRLHREG